LQVIGRKARREEFAIVTPAGEESVEEFAA
jgi:hypothetical protein